MSEDFPVVSGEEVTETQINSKKYLVKTTKPTGDEGLIGDVCFVIE